MAKINYEKMSVVQLTDHIARAQRALAAAKDRERVDLKLKIAALANDAGLSLSELFGARRRGGSSAVKYVNPDNRSETWTGRGRKPNWLVAKVKKGAKLEDFAI